MKHAIRFAFLFALEIVLEYLPTSPPLGVAMLKGYIERQLPDWDVKILDLNLFVLNKIMSGLDIAERRVPQDGKFQLKVEGRQIDFRVSVLPCVHGEKVVLRILDKSAASKDISELGFSSKDLAMASTRLSYRSLSESTSAPFGPATVMNTLWWRPSHTQVALALAIPANARLKSSKSWSETTRSIVNTVNGAFCRASVKLSGSAAPEDLIGLLTSFSPRGRVRG